MRCIAVVGGVDVLLGIHEVLCRVCVFLRCFVVVVDIFVFVLFEAFVCWFFVLLSVVGVFCVFLIMFVFLNVFFCVFNCF